MKSGGCFYGCYRIPGLHPGYGLETFNRSRYLAAPWKDDNKPL